MPAFKPLVCFVEKQTEPQESGRLFLGTHGAQAQPSDSEAEPPLPGTSLYHPCQPPSPSLDGPEQLSSAPWVPRRPSPTTEQVYSLWLLSSCPQEAEHEEMANSTASSTLSEPQFPHLQNRGGQGFPSSLALGTLGHLSAAAAAPPFSPCPSPVLGDRPGPLGLAWGEFGGWVGWSGRLASP